MPDDPAPDTLAPAAPPAGRRRPRWPIWAVIIVSVLAWGAWCGLNLLRAAHQLRAGVAAANRVRGEVSVQELADNTAGPDLAVAHRDFAQAHHEIRSFWLSPLRILPFVGRQIRSVDALSGAATTVTAVGSQALSQAHGLLHAPHHTPAERLTVIDELSRIVVQLSGQLAHVSLGPSGGLLHTLATKRATFVKDLGRIQTDMTNARAATAALSDVLTGPRTYLLLAANNAEMRAGSGMFLEVGTLTTDHGQIQLGSFKTASQLALPKGLVPMTGDLAARWGQQQPNREWRNLALSPQFDQTAALASRMWQAQTGQRVDGVLAVDDDFVKELLSVTGPVTSAPLTSGPVTLTADNVEQYLLEGQYAGLPYTDPAVARHEQLGLLAAQVFNSVEGTSTSIPRLATALTAAVNGRHALLWSADPAIEADWRTIGAAGRLGPDDLLLAVMNQGANKLDPYLRVTSVLDVTPSGPDTSGPDTSGPDTSGPDTTVTVTVTITNADSDPAPGYANGGAVYPPGMYVGTVALDFPKRAGNAVVVGRNDLVAAGSDETATVLAVPIRLDRGAQTTVTFRFRLAGVHGQLRVDPSARIPPTTWNTQRPGAPTSTSADDLAHTVSW